MPDNTTPRSAPETEAQLLEVLPMITEKVDSIGEFQDPALIEAAHNLCDSLRVGLGIPQ